jgi:hypothetical protein
VLPVDQNNVVDRTQYHYVLEVQDEQGLTGWPWQVSVLQPCALCFFGTQNPAVSYTQLGGPGTACDGVNLSSLPNGGVGARILLANTLGQQETGVYVISAANGAIQRAQDFQLASQFTQGLVVGIQQGQKFAGTWWQATASVPSWTPGNVPLWTGGVEALFWTASSAGPWTTNSVVLPQTPSGYWYQAQSFGGSGGVTGSAEPAWPTQIGATLVENPGANQIVWKCMGPISTPMPWVTRPDADSEVLGLAMTHYGTIFESAAVLYTNITTNTWQ